MRKTDLESTNRLKNQESCCSFRGLLFNKATLFFALLLLPTVIFAQNREQQQMKEELAKKEMLEAQKPQLTERQLQEQAHAKQKMAEYEANFGQHATVEKQNAEMSEYDTKLLKFNLAQEAEKMLNSGMSKSQVKKQILDGLDSMENQTNDFQEYARQGSNDCSGAVEIDCNDGPIAGSTAGFSNTGFINCGGGASAGNGVWYVMTGDNANNTVSVTGFTGARVSVYSGSCGALQCQGGVAGQGTGSASFFAAGGDTYYLYVHGGATASGAYTIELTSSNCQAPTGDGLSSATALPIGCGDVDSGNTADYLNTEVGPAACAFSVGQRGVWYVLNTDSDFPNGTGVTVDLCGSGMDTEVHVYTGAALDCLISEDDDFTNCGGNDPSVDFDAQPNTDYYIYVTHWSSGTTTGAYNISVQCDGIAPPPPPSIPNNNECPEAEEISCVGGTQIIPGTTILADDADEPSDTCGNGLNGVGVWYVIEGDGSSYIVGTCGYDTELTVLTGSCGDLTCIQSNDDTTRPDCTGSFGESQVNFNTVEGEFYYLYVSSWSSSTQSDFDLIVECIPPPEPPANDDCEDAESIACGDIVSGNIALATADINPACGDNAANGTGAWYSYTGTGDIVDVIVEGVTMDATVSVYTGSCTNLTCVDGDNGNFSDDSVVRFSSEAGTEYLIFVSFFNGTGGQYNLELFCQPNPCNEAVTIECGDSLVGSTGPGFGSDAGPSDSCAGIAPGTWSTFFVMTGTDELVTLTTCGGTTFDTKLHVYQGSCTDLVCVTSNDDMGSANCSESGLRSEVNFFAEAGETYYIQVNGFGSSRGDFTLTASCQEPVGNDTCDQAIALSCDSSIDGSTTFATNRGKPENDCSEISEDFNEGVWYTVTGTGGNITLSTCDANFDTKLLLYTGSCDDGFDCIAGNDNGCGDGSTLTFASDADQVYYIYVTGSVGTFTGTDRGDFTLTVECECLPGEVDNSCVTVYEGYTTEYSQETLTGEILYGNGNISYSWSPGGETTQSITVDAADGTQNYTVTMTDEDGCSVTQSFYVRSVFIDCDRGGSNKVEICHNGNTICVNENAVASHLAHGDTLGACGTQLCDEVAPECDVTITSPADGETDVDTSPTISWSIGTGIVTGYMVEVSDANGVVESGDAGNALSYNVASELELSTDYTVTVIPYNDNGMANGCGSSSFTTTGVAGDGLSSATGLPVSCGETVSGFTGDYANTEVGRTDCNFNFSTGPNGVWYTVTGNGGSITLSLCSSTSDTEVSVYTGAARDCVTYNDDFCGLRSQVTFASIAGQDYYVYIAGYASFSGPVNYVMDVTCSGARQSNPELEWSLYPNPSRGQVNLDLKDFVNNDINVQVVDLRGNVVLNRTVQNLQDPKLQIELNNVPYGMYFVRVQSQDNVSTKRLIIKN